MVTVTHLELMTFELDDSHGGNDGIRTRIYLIDNQAHYPVMLHPQGDVAVAAGKVAGVPGRFRSARIDSCPIPKNHHEGLAGATGFEPA